MLVELFTDFCFGLFDDTVEGLLKTKEVVQNPSTVQYLLTFHFRLYVCNALNATGYFSRSHIKVSVEFQKAP